MKAVVKIRFIEGEKPAAEQSIELIEQQEFSLTGKFLSSAAPGADLKIFGLIILKAGTAHLRVGPNAYSILLNSPSGDEFILHRILLRAANGREEFGGEEISVQEGDRVTLADRTLEFTSVPEAPQDRSIIAATVSNVKNHPGITDEEKTGKIKKKRSISVQAFSQKTFNLDDDDTSTSTKTEKSRTGIGTKIGRVHSFLETLLNPFEWFRKKEEPHTSLAQTDEEIISLEADPQASNIQAALKSKPPGMPLGPGKKPVIKHSAATSKHTERNRKIVAAAIIGLLIAGGAAMYLQFQSDIDEINKTFKAEGVARTGKSQSWKSAVRELWNTWMGIAPTPAPLALSEIQPPVANNPDSTPLKREPAAVSGNGVATPGVGASTPTQHSAPSSSNTGTSYFSVMNGKIESARIILH